MSLWFVFRAPIIAVPLAVASGLLLWFVGRRDNARVKARDDQWQALGPTVGNIWRRLFEAEGLGDLVELVGAHVRPAVRVSTTRVPSLALDGSRVGGTPDFAPGMTWPRRNGKPMAFLAQLDLEAVASVLPDTVLPRTGSLWFFYDIAGWPVGHKPADADGWAVLYRDSNAGLESAAAPPDLHKKLAFPLCAVTLEAFEDIPDPSIVPRLDAELQKDDARLEMYLEIFSFLARGQRRDPHKLLGFANSIQDVMEEEVQLVTNGITHAQRRKERARVEELQAGVQDWRLLLQVESDGEAGMMWGDAGCLYFWIREQDLKAARFDRVWMVLQCH